MAHLITAIFKDKKAAGKAVAELKEKGYTDNISLIAVDDSGKITSHQIKEDVTGGVVSGAAIGGALGGIAGLLVTISTAVVPGIGTILVAGPLAAAWGLAGASGGAITGGLLGGLIDAGIPEKRAENYIEAIRRGEVLITVTGNHESEPEITEIFNKYGAFDGQVQHQAL